MTNQDTSWEELRNEMRKIIFSHSVIYSETNPSDLPYVDTQVDEIMNIFAQRKQRFLEQVEKKKVKQPPKDSFFGEIETAVYVFGGNEAIDTIKEIAEREL